MLLAVCAGASFCGESSQVTLFSLTFASCRDRKAGVDLPEITGLSLHKISIRVMLPLELTRFCSRVGMQLG